MGGRSTGMCFWQSCLKFLSAQMPHTKAFSCFYQGVEPCKVKCLNPTCTRKVGHVISDDSDKLFEEVEESNFLRAY